MPYFRFWKPCQRLGRPWRLPHIQPCRLHKGLLTSLLLSACCWAAAATASDLPPADTDAVTIEAFPFGHAEVDQLKREGVVYLSGPHGTLRIALIARHSSSQGERLDISVDGMPGTITRSGPGFFASLPSRNGSLRLENNGNSTRLIEEQVLDQRNLPQLSDYRTPVAR